MSDEWLPKDEPGAPLVRVNPGFADKVMHRIERFDRQQKRVNRGMALFVVLAAAVIVTAVVRNYAGRTPSDEDFPQPQHADVPRLESSPGGGVVVQSIDPKSPLAKVVQKGDVVKSIDRHPVNDASRAAALLRALDNCKATEFVVVRDSRTRTVITPSPNAAPCRSPGVTPR